MTRTGLLLAVSVLVASGFADAQEKAPPHPFNERARAMTRRAVRENGAYETLASLIRHAPQRLSGSPGAAAAVEWGRQAMLRIGLENVRLEKVMVPHWVRGSICQVQITNPATEAAVPLAATALGGSIGTPKVGISGDLIEVTSLDALRKIGKKGVTGKIVLWNKPFDNSLDNMFAGYSGAVWQRTRGAIEAGMRGAVAVLVRSVTSMPDDVPHTGAMQYKDGIKKIPAAAVSVKAAEHLHRLIASGTKVVVRMRMDCTTLPDVPSANVVGEIVGNRTPEELVLIGAHLDAWDVAQGAHDDGAGVAHVLEAARLIKTSGPGPGRTIRVVLFMNEENGLRGARAYAKTHANEVSRHVLAIETDSGGYAPHGFGITPSKGYLKALQPVGDVLRELRLGRITSGGGGADIGPLRVGGVPLMALRVAGDRYFDLHHSAKDVLENVHPRELCRGAAALAIMALWVADLDRDLRQVAGAAAR